MAAESKKKLEAHRLASEKAAKALKEK